MANERDILNPLLKAASAAGARLFRQNTGVGWVGRMVSNKGGTVMLAGARPLHAGLCKGSSDVIGWTPVVITPDMVGKTVAVFTALELKTPGVATTDEQRRFVEAVRAGGGFAQVVRSVDEGLAALNPLGL